VASQGKLSTAGILLFRVVFCSDCLRMIRVGLAIADHEAPTSARSWASMVAVK
jgi:hypothetical protein